MSDFKSKLPDLKEITAMAGKLFKDVKTSVCEIIEDYKQKHPEDDTHQEETKPEVPVEKKPETKKKEK